MKKSIAVLMVALLIAAASLVTGCKKGETAKPEQNSKGVEVAVGNPLQQKMTEYIPLNGNTFYQKQELIRGSFGGYIDKVYKNVGDYVKQGDVLFLVKTKEADAESKESALHGGEQFSGIVKIAARTNGVLIELDHQTGDYIADGEQLAVVVDPSSLRIALEVPFEFSGKISPKSSFLVDLPDGKQFTVQGAKKVPSMDPANQTERYILEPSSARDLPANLNVGIKIPLRSSDNAIVLPNSALMTNETQTEYWVMKVINDSVAVKQTVQKGIESDNMVQILEPKLSLSDRFITEGAFGLPDTANIEIQGDKK